MLKRSALNSPRLAQLRRQRKKASRRKIFFYGLFIILIFIILSFLTKINRINIENISVADNQIVETEDITKIVNKNLKGKYLWLFPKTNFLLYPKAKIKKELNENFKRIKKVSLRVQNFQNLQLNVEEYDGKYLWCGNNIPLDQGIPTTCYFLDENGYLFDEAPFFSGNIYFKFYGSDGLKEVNPIDSYFLQTYFRDLIIFKDDLNKMGLSTDSFWLDDSNNANMALSGEGLNGPKIIFKIDSDFKKVAENLQAAISTEPLNQEFKKKFNSLLYIDLRFGNKVFYKFK